MRTVDGSSISVSFQVMVPDCRGTRPEQGADQDRLAGADRPGDHHELAAGHREADVAELLGVVEGHRQVADRQACGADRCRGRWAGEGGETGSNAGGPSRNQVSTGAEARSGSWSGMSRASRAPETSAWRCHADQRAVMRGKARHGGGVGGEQSDVAGREAAVLHGRGHEDEGQPQPGVGGDAAQGLGELGADLVPPGGLGPGATQRVEPGEHGGLGGRHLDGGDGTEGVADEAGHARRGLALGPSPAAEASGEQVADPEDDDDRGDDGDGRSRGDQEQHDHARHGGQAGRDEVEPDIEDLGDVPGIVAEAADGLAGRPGQAVGDGPRVGDEGA